MISTWSYSRLKIFESCPYHAYLEYAEKRPIPPTVNKTAADRGTRVHEQCEKWIRGEEVTDFHKLLEKKSDILDEYKEAFTQSLVEVEEDWGFTSDWQPCGFFDDNVWGRMKLDVFYRPTPEYGIPIDWKTGKAFGNEMYHTQQGQAYAIGCFARYPELEFAEVQFHYLDQNCKPLTRKYTREKAEKLQLSLDKRARRMTEATEFPAKPNKINCRWCPYSPNNGGDSSCPWGVEV